MMGSFEEILAATVRVAVREEVRSAVREALEEVKPPHSDYLSVVEAADIAGVSTKTVRAWIKDRKLTPGHAGREHRVRRDELVRLLESPQDSGDRTPEAVAAAILKKG